MSTGVRSRPATKTGGPRSQQPAPGRWQRLRLWWRTRRSQGRPRRRLLTWLALVALLAGGVVFLFFFSAALVVKDIEVSGGREQVQESAVELAQIPLGRPLARVAEGAVGERVLTDPRIAEVVVERDWPSTVRLVLTEREPVVAFTREDSTWLADAGITRGCNPPENDRFCPDDAVTRAQMATFLMRTTDLLVAERVATVPAAPAPAPKLPPAPPTPTAAFPKLRRCPSTPPRCVYASIPTRFSASRRNRSPPSPTRSEPSRRA